MNMPQFSSPFQSQSSQWQEVSTQGVPWCLNRNVCPWSRGPSLQRGSLLEQTNRLKPLFSRWLPCGLNGFRWALYPWQAAHRGGICFFFPWHQQMRKRFSVFLLAHLEGANDQQELSETCLSLLGVWVSMCSFCIRSQVGLHEVSASERKG